MAQWQTNSFVSKVLCFSLVYLQPIHTCFSLKVNLGARFCKNHGACWLSNKKSTMLNPQFPPHSVVNEDRSQPSPGGANLDAHLGGWIIQRRRIIYLRKIWISNDMIDVSKLFSIDFNWYDFQKILFSNDMNFKDMIFKLYSPKNLYVSLKQTCLVLGFAFPRLNSFHQQTLKTCTHWERYIISPCKMPITLPSTGILMGATAMVYEWIDCAFCGGLAKLFGSICFFQVNGSYKLPTYIPTCKNTKTNTCHGAPTRKLK